MPSPGCFTVGKAMQGAWRALFLTMHPVQCVRHRFYQGNETNILARLYCYIGLLKSRKPSSHKNAARASDFKGLILTGSVSDLYAIPLQGVFDPRTSALPAILKPLAD
jgi:hypothetical protein